MPIYCHNVLVTSLLQVKCEQYWPREEHGYEVYGDIEVTLSSQSNLGPYVLRTLQVKKVIVGFYFILQFFNINSGYPFPFPHSNPSLNYSYSLFPFPQK
jgi:hypothetical protein